MDGANEDLFWFDLIWFTEAQRSTGGWEASMHPRVSKRILFVIPLKYSLSCNSKPKPNIMYVFYVLFDSGIFFSLRLISKVVYLQSQVAVPYFFFRLIVYSFFPYFEILFAEYFFLPTEVLTRLKNFIVFDSRRLVCLYETSFMYTRIRKKHIYRWNWWQMTGFRQGILKLFDWQMSFRWFFHDPCRTFLYERSCDVF